MNAPLVSVAMVTRNVERFLPEAIESILKQTWKDLDLMIVDFGSTDRSKLIISEYQSKDPRVKFHEVPSCTLSEARNASCFLSTGRYIAIMDADDVAVPDRLARQVEFLERHPAVGVLGGATEWIDENGKALCNHFYPTGASEIRDALLSGSPFCNPTVVIRRDIFAAAGGFRKPFVSAEDYDLWLRVAERCEMANLPNVVLRYRIHPHQESQRNVMQMTMGALAARAAADARNSGKPDPLDSVEEITPATISGLGVEERTRHTALARHYLTWIRLMLGAGQHAVALELAGRALTTEDLRQAEKWAVADIRLAASQTYWRQGRFFRSATYACHAVLTRPVLLARPFKPLLARSRARLQPSPGGEPAIGPGR